MPGARRFFKLYAAHHARKYHSRKRRPATKRPPRRPGPYPLNYLLQVRNRRNWQISADERCLSRSLEGNGKAAAANALLQHRPPFGAVSADCALFLSPHGRRCQFLCSPKPYRFFRIIPTIQNVGVSDRVSTLGRGLKEKDDHARGDWGMGGAVIGENRTAPLVWGKAGAIPWGCARWGLSGGETGTLGLATPITSTREPLAEFR
jgi:hypothetical protein